MKDFRWRVPKQAAKATPLHHALGKFFQQALELVDGDIGTMQEVVTLLTTEGGLLRIDELLNQSFDTFSPAQLTRVLNTQLIPFFKILTNENVISSILLRSKVVTIYNIMYSGNGGDQRSVALFSALASHFSDSGLLDTLPTDGKVDSELLEAVEITTRVLSNIVEFNTPAHANPGFLPIAETFTALLNNLPPDTAFSMNKARKAFQKLQQRLGIGKTIPDAQHNQRSTGIQATFQLARDMPGELSDDGPRHDNDHANIRQISILPTLQEIQSSRNEYLPVASSQEWHLEGISGLVDRHFRLLREDTVGQLRDAAKVELERLQNPQHHIEPKRQGARTFVYHDVYIAGVGFDDYHGAQVALRFTRPKANKQKSKNARNDWWESSKRLGQDALICLLNSQGSATFFVVGQQGKQPTELQSAFNLASDPENAYVVAKPLSDSDFHNLLSHSIEGSGYAQLSIVEFPGVLLPSFEPTLKAMQHISETLDMPFSHILAPASGPEHPNEEMDVQPPTFATRPGFKYDLSKVTTANEAFHFTPGEDITDAAAKLAQSSTLDLGQAQAVIGSLARSFAAIQGPPGTGKSYTGIQLVRVLLSNKAATGIGPIIVCTHTNHALDSILERSVDDSVSGIVRIGGRCKSERLKYINLRVLAKNVDPTKTEKTRRWELHRTIEHEVEEINSLLRSLEAIRNHSAVESHLLENYPQFHSRIFGHIPEEDDGFTTVTYKRESEVEIWLKAGYHGRGHQRSVDELLDVHPQQMTTAERRVMLTFWTSEMKNELLEKLRHASCSYNESREELETIRTELDLRVLRQANIIGITTSGLARNIELLRGVGSKVLICEEAGEVLEAHMLTALLPSIEHCILIGDHQQLRPQVQNYDLSTESRNGSQYALDVSLFERLVQPQDTFAQPLPLSSLEVQRRMHPSISQLVRETQYPRLQDDPRVSQYPEVVGMRRRLFWMHHNHLENDTSESTSRTNSFEVDMVAALVKHIVQQGVYKPDDIAVITPYLGQLRMLRQKFSSAHTILLNDRDIDDLEREGINSGDAPSAQSNADVNTVVSKGSLSQALRLATVDNFQGEEAKVIIVSLVRSNKTNSAGFLKTPNRINVLLSRAQHGMYIIGNANTTQSIPMWHDVVEILRKDGNLGEDLELCCPRHPDTPMLVQNPTDFARLSPEAGCDLLCEKQLACGHACIAKCHSDMLHGAVYCMKPCTRIKDGCEHLCPKPCGDACDLLCNFPIVDVDVMLRCGHTKTHMPCHEYQKPATIICQEPVKRTIPGCNHEIVTDCHVDVEHDAFNCFADCGKVLPCGHTCQKACYKCNTRVNGEITRTDHGKCQQKCDRGYSTCKHRCTSTCHGSEPCPLCTQECDTRCSHARCYQLCSQFCSPCLEEQCSSGTLCPHNDPCPMPCAAPCTWIPCSERCDQTLSCGCRCPSVCGEECPDAKFCQKHGSAYVKAMQADLIMFTSYQDIDLDTDPCIFTPCGHIFTIDSLDGTMGMQEHYEVNPLTGRYTGLKASAEPFSIEDSKPCPECRSSLRSLARYGRIVRRALLDESAKKLTAWSNSKHQQLAISLADLEGELMDSLDFPRKPTQKIRLEGPLNAQLESVKQLKTSKRYQKIRYLIDDISRFAFKLSKDEQPYQRVHDLVEVVRRQGTSIAEFDFGSEELQLREHLQADNLLIRSHLVLMRDIIIVHSQTPSSTQADLRVNFSANRELCEELIDEAHTSKNVRQEAEAQIHWAKFAAMECGILESISEDEIPGSQRRLDNLKKSAIARLDSVSLEAKSMKNLAVEAADVRRMFREGVSSSEMRMIVGAMAAEFSGTGHWYRCANGHPFTVGECGMPMQLAKCPECGAGVGGQSHRPTEGVTHASDIEERFGGLSL